MGASGSGKSTLLHLPGGLDLPDSGTITIGDRHVDGSSETERARLRRTEIGYVSQSYNLLPALTAVIIVVALGNLAATMASTARERERRMGVLRSIEFSSHQLLGQSAIAGAVIGAVPAMIGISLGFLASKTLLGLIMNAIGIGQGLATVPNVGPLMVCCRCTSTSDLLRAKKGGADQQISLPSGRYVCQLPRGSRVVV